VAVKTVENHKIRIFSKLGVRTQAQAVALAITHGLLTAAAPSLTPSEWN
jgi:DNA-binding NarL/FixJ family response regulator